MNTFLSEHEEIIQLAKHQVHAASRRALFVTTRLKSARSTIEKLRRTPSMTLRQMHDIAGVRVVITGGRPEQDQECQALAAAWPAARLIDRREKPSNGYRAVHVVFKLNGRWVEIQVRTPLQHHWAELFEVIGDRVGRQIRYGDPPNSPDQRLAAGMTQSELVEGMLAYADGIAAHEIQTGLPSISLEELDALLDQVDSVRRWLM